MTIFEPIQVGNLQLQHRVVLSPMTRFRCNEKGVQTDIVPEYYSQRATPGGLLIAESTVISPNAGAYPYVPGIFNKEQIASYRKVAKDVHEKGGYIFLQIVHLGRVGSAKFNEDHKPPVAPSAIAINGPNNFIQPIGSANYEVPREATKEEIKKVITDFVVAAKNAVDKAGFDGVEIHGGNGFLIDQFINSSSNTRTDEYGGSIENRTRLAFDVVEAVARSIGPERTGIRFSPFSGVQDVKDDTPYETWGHILKNLNPKLAYVHFIEPREDFAKQPDLVNSLDPFRKLWKGPFISAGGYTTNSEFIESVAKDTGNLIAVGRAFIANPDLVERLKRKLPLNKYDRDTFYTTGPVGYTDYPFYAEA
ncbi:12-oxo-phytodienoic acid-like protein [Fennellomyces sp. T-0311]|nr:12-oxo-phytodienoic acid-like protein [Fennellomyces sp. T-0311]